MLKKVLPLILCVGITVHADDAPGPKAPVPTEAQPTVQQTSCPDWLLTSLWIIDLAAIHILTAPEPVRQNFIRQLSLPNLTRTVITQYLSWYISTLAHECGHAATKKLLTGTNSSIHIGSMTNTNAKPLLTLGPISIDTINPTTGHTHSTAGASFASFLADYRAKHKLETVKLTRQQLSQVMASEEYAAFKGSIISTPNNLLITAAGSICGLIAHHLMQKITTGELTLDHITINQLFNLLLPFNPNNDAAILWREGAGIPDHIITAISAQNELIHISLAKAIDIAMEIYLAIKETGDPMTTPLHSQILIGLINYNARGFLRFHA